MSWNAFAPHMSAPAVPSLACEEWRPGPVLKNSNWGDVVGHSGHSFLPKDAVNVTGFAKNIGFATVYIMTSRSMRSISTDSPKIEQSTSDPVDSRQKWYPAVPASSLDLSATASTEEIRSSEASNKDQGFSTGVLRTCISTGKSWLMPPNGVLNNQKLLWLS